MGRKKIHQPDGRKRFRRVQSLTKWLKAHGSGEEGRLAREAFAARVGTTLPYLVHIALGNRRVSMELAVKIEKASHGQVSAEELFPSADWEWIKSRRLAAGAAHA